jgi:hypothetical protein
MKCNENIAFLVIVFCKLHFKKKSQLLSKFSWVVELRLLRYPPICLTAKSLFLMTFDASFSFAFIVSRSLVLLGWNDSTYCSY